MATATMSRAKVERPLDDMKSKKKDIIQNLNAALATSADLSLVAKQAHWNVRGPNFQGLHELFDTIAVEARQYSDELAERAVALGGLAQGTVQDIVKSTSLAQLSSSETRWDALVRAVHDRVLTASDQARQFAAGLEDDLATQDLYIEIIRGYDKWAWMLEAHLG